MVNIFTRIDLMKKGRDWDDAKDLGIGWAATCLRMNRKRANNLDEATFTTANESNPLDGIKKHVRDLAAADGRERSGLRSKITPDIIRILMEKLNEECDENGKYMTGKLVKELLEKITGVEYSIQHCRRIMSKMGYRYDRLQARYELTEERLERVRTFLKEYDEAYRAELRGDCIIVYIDETYVHQHHCRGYGWVFSGGKRKEVNSAIGK